VPIKYLIQQFQISGYMDRIGVVGLSTGYHVQRSIAFKGEADIGKVDLTPWTQEEVVERKEPIVFVELGIFAVRQNCTNSRTASIHGD